MVDTQWFHGARPLGVGLALAASTAVMLAGCGGAGASDTDGAQTETAEGSTTDSPSDGTTGSSEDPTTSGTALDDSGSSSDTGEDSDPLADLLKFLGGEQALVEMTGFRSSASGTRAVANEGQHAGDPAMQIGTFEAVVSYDLAGDAVRVDYERFNEFLGGVPVSYAETYNGQLGYISGDDGVIFPGPSDAPMLSTRWASGRKQLALLHPHLLLRDVLAGTRSAAISEVGLDGCDAVIEIEDTISPIALCVLDSGELTGLHTMVNDFLLRDVELFVSYSAWSGDGDGDGVRFPAEVSLHLDGDVIHRETREVEVNPSFDPASFELPEEGVFDIDMAHWGEATHQFFQTFVAMGIPLDFPLTNVEATELAPGIHHLTGATHNSMVVEQERGVIVIEAPNHPERGEAVLAWVADNIPDKPITYAISTHHHEDHSAGLRAFAAAGIEIVMHEDSVDYFAEEVFTAPSTIVPDALASADVDPQLTGVGAGGLVLDDPQNTITLSHLPNGHSADMLLIHVAGGGGIVFVSDVYNPGNGGMAFNPAWAQSLLDALAEAEPTSWIAGGHVGVAPVQELVDYVGG